MKKNRFVKIAICMAMLSLLTLCVVGTTFAKYTTGGSASDQARVAKWGVSVSMEADPLFKGVPLIVLNYQKGPFDCKGAVNEVD